MQQKQKWHQGLKQEWDRITWPTPKETAKRALLVIVSTAILGVVVAYLDTGIQKLLEIVMR